MAARRRGAAATGLLRDFRDFALKGNIVELAIAVIIGGAFGKIISALVENILMPLLINPLIPDGNWRDAVIPPGIGIGAFLGAVIDFVIIALVLFLLIRFLASFKQKEEVLEESVPDPNLVVQEKLVETLDRLAEVLETQKR